MRTIFNLLGPLTNPAGARRQVVGVADPAALDLVAGALARLGTDRALVVSSADGLDELSTSGPTHVVEVEGEQLTRYVVEPEECRARRCGASRTSTAGRRRTTRATSRAILAGEPGPRADLALLNAGAAIYAAGAPTRSPTASRARAPRRSRAEPPSAALERLRGDRAKSWPARRERARAHRRGHARGASHGAVARFRSPSSSAA